MASSLQGLLGAELVGVYLGGSLALGGYEPGRSDVDVAAFVHRPLSPDEKAEVVAAVRHEALACPARKLELVVSVPERLPDFELNLNSGADEHHVDLTSERASAFWFAIDASVVREHGVALVGPPAADVVPALSRASLETALRAAIRWQIDNRMPADDLVLNACRARRFLDEGVWSSKLGAGEWALERFGGDVVASALAVRRRLPGANLSFERGRGFAEAALESSPPAG